MTGKKNLISLILLKTEGNSVSQRSVRGKFLMAR